jgi:Amt family ammonium transporter
MLASASGAGAATVYVWGRYGKPDPTWMANGMLAGLVAITAPCAFVSAPAAIFIGAVSGVLVVVGALFVEGTLRIDDPVGAIAVHGINGAWGVLSLGLFANGVYGDGWNGVDGKVTGLFFGNPGQFVAECIGVLVDFVYVGGVTAISLFVLDNLVGNRVPAEEELAGLDIPQHGVAGYHDGPKAPATATVTPSTFPLSPN